jgi:hypothetical protein
LSNATTSANIESVPTGIGRHAQIIRRKRNPDIKFVKFKRPQKEAE